MRKYIFFYIFIVSFSSFLLFATFKQGTYLETERNKVYRKTEIITGKSVIRKNENTQKTEEAKSSQPKVASLPGGELSRNLKLPVSILILQIISIIVFARLFSNLLSKMGQPAVIGEIIAGIVLGPSLLGWLFPGLSSFLFPPESLKNLQFLSQIGLILFMFIIGLELDIKAVRTKAHVALAVSHASIIFPYLLGVFLAYFLYNSFAPPNISFLAFGLFMGIVMSITAFPVLARIIQERGMTKTTLGSMALTCAAINDLTAWCILAAVIAIVKAGTVTDSLYTIIMAAVFVLFMLCLFRPLLKRLVEKYVVIEKMSKGHISLIFIIMLSSAYIAEIIGIHALFGAFLAGVIIPDSLNMKEVIIEKIEDVSLVLLLPVFFVLTGLRTQIGLLNTGYLWLTCLLIILVAVTGKFCGTALTARLLGQSWKDSLSLGVLMNTRGLMELIVLNIGYDLGILTPEVFAMMVLMALVTTFMTGPALDLIEKSG